MSLDKVQPEAGEDKEKQQNKILSWPAMADHKFFYGLCQKRRENKQSLHNGKTYQSSQGILFHCFWGVTMRKPWKRDFLFLKFPYRLGEIENE